MPFRRQATMVGLQTHIYITRPQWVKASYSFQMSFSKKRKALEKWFHTQRSVWIQRTDYIINQLSHLDHRGWLYVFAPIPPPPPLPPPPPVADFGSRDDFRTNFLTSLIFGRTYGQYITQFAHWIFKGKHLIRYISGKMVRLPRNENKKYGMPPMRT